MKNVLFFIGEREGRLTILVRLHSMWFAYTKEDFYGVDLSMDKEFVIQDVTTLIESSTFIDKVCADAIQNRGWTYLRYVVGQSYNAVPVEWAKSYQKQAHNVSVSLQMIG